jgi:hypothetical protein
MQIRSYGHFVELLERHLGRTIERRDRNALLSTEVCSDELELIFVRSLLADLSDTGTILVDPASLATLTLGDLYSAYARAAIAAQMQ